MLAERYGMGADQLRTELVLDAVGMAIFTQKPEPGLIRHTEGGSPYTAYDFGRTSPTPSTLASRGRVGAAVDCAMAETIVTTLKTEFVYRRPWPTRHELEMEVFSYLQGFYNSRYRYFRLGDLSPTDYKQQLVT